MSKSNIPNSPVPDCLEREKEVERADLFARVEVLCRCLELKASTARGVHLDEPVRFEPDWGRRGVFLRIAVVDRGQMSVHAFVDLRTGCLVKAATWRAPQKDRAGNLAVRFDLYSDADFARALELCDPSGTYLYAR